MGLLQARGAGWSCLGSVCAAGQGVGFYVPRPRSVTTPEDELREERWGPGLGRQLLSGVGKTAPVPRSSEAGCVTAPQAEAPGRPGARSLAGLAAHVDRGVPALPLCCRPGLLPARRRLRSLLREAPASQPAVWASCDRWGPEPCPLRTQLPEAGLPRLQKRPVGSALACRRGAVGAALPDSRGYKRFCSFVFVDYVSPSFPPSESGCARAVSPRFQKRPVRLSRGPLTRGAGSGDGATASPLGLVTKYVGKQDSNKTFSS